MKNYDLIKKKVENLKDVTTRLMFGYQCYLISRKFFVGFSDKNNYQIIVRLPKDKQGEAIEHKAIQPFSHGAKMGWIEINSRKIVNSSVAIKWIFLAYEHAQSISK